MMRRLALLAALVIAGSYVLAAPPPQTFDLDDVLAFDTRQDMEVLADTVFGVGQRPLAWTGDNDLESPTFQIDLWFDNEQLADEVFGLNVRPDTWLGAPVPAPAAIARNVRHDLELTADQVLGGSRPVEWRGGPPVQRCSRELQNILDLLAQFYDVRSTTPESVLDFCASVQAEIEDDLLDIIFNAPGAEVVDPVDLVAAVRGDLERLADELLGLNTRPEGYIGNRDRTSATLIGDIFLDMGLLADVELDGGRPNGWIGAISNAPLLSYLNLRNDLELLANATLGPGVRPNGWQGVDPLEQCAPLTRSLVVLVQLNYGL
ncbi:MAG: hypothetical protein GYB67_03655, partial [Chloroflexi bacterium]|nr:hypothetical protein [Chloroflexota bacterium]